MATLIRIGGGVTAGVFVGVRRAKECPAASYINGNIVYYNKASEAS